MSDNVCLFLGSLFVDAAVVCKHTVSKKKKKLPCIFLTRVPCADPHVNTLDARVTETFCKRIEHTPHNKTLLFSMMQGVKSLISTHSN